jgi:integrase/recombinase XerD
VVISRLQVVSRTSAVGITLEEQLSDHRRLIEGYIRSRRLRNLNGKVNKSVQRGLDAFFSSVGKVAWEVTEEHVAVWQERLLEASLAVATRRSYLGFVRTFYAYLREHPYVPLSQDELQVDMKPATLQVKYGRAIIQPVNPWVAASYSADDATTKRYMPTREELQGFFGWLRRRIETARKPLPLARDYALYRLLYHSGLRANELVNLTVRDIRLETRIIHVRVGKGTNGSGPRSRWVPMMYGIDRVLDIYLKQVRGKLAPTMDSKDALFVVEGGGAIQGPTVRNRLSLLISEACADGVMIDAFAPHDLRRAFATHFYEEYPMKVELLREILGHLSVLTTMRYTRPSRKYYEQQFASVLDQRFSGFPEGGES